MGVKLKDTLLLVGDEGSDRPIFREIFKDSFNILEAENLLQAALLLKQNDTCIAAVLIDMEQLKDEDIKLVNSAAHQNEDDEIPIISFIPHASDGKREELAFLHGARDVVVKPYTPDSLRRRLEIIINLYLHKQQLQTLVTKQAETIRNTNQVMLDAMSTIIEHRSTESGNHVLRIRRFTKILLEDVANTYPEYALTQQDIDIITSAAALHDIGKISIPDDILNKPGKLTDEEFEIMKTHTTIGSELIQQLTGMGDADFLRYAYNIALYHHERWDGNGYPFGLCEDEIPICAQVVGIADVFDALTTPRVYKEAYSHEQAINMILNDECGKFSPRLLECVKHVRSTFAALATQYADGYSPKDDSISIPLPGPVWENTRLNTSQLSYIKYQTILHYLNDTVVELDLDKGLHHIVYNPNPDFDSVLSNAPFQNASDLLKYITLHPDDISIIDDIDKLFSEERAQSNMYYKTLTCRILSPSTGQYQAYELVFMRVNTGNSAQHIFILVWHRLRHSLAEHNTLIQNGLHNSPALQGLVSTALRCCSDKELTIDAGAKELFMLTGYTEEDIKEQFDNKLLHMIVHSDRDSLLANIEKCRQTGGRLDTEFRILRKNNTPLWVLIKSRLYIETDGQEYFYLAMRDNSHGKMVEHNLKTTVERNQLIIDQLGGIVFEWNLKTDTMYCSHKWEEHFGYAPVSKNYGSQFGIATHFHPDDLPLVRNSINNIRNNHEAICIDVRIANANAKYLWTRISATAFLDENDELVRITGILQDIDTVKRAEQTLKEKAERDSLTKLLNKASTQQLISEYLGEREEDNLDALLIIDIDNFKFINDNLGHLYGDSVLAKAGSLLKSLFRSQDIIGRIGGDEFLILMRDIPSKDLVHTRCNMLLSTFRELFEEFAPGMNVSCSIGAALIPEHGTAYSDIFRHADEALYNSKNRGKNTYTLYDPLTISDVLPESIHIATRIDSEERPGMADASFVRSIFHQLYESKDIFATLNDILAYTGESLNVSRVYIFENNDDNSTCSNTFEWCNEGITPEKDNLQNISYIEDINGWPELFNEYGIMYCTDIKSLDDRFRAILEPQNIKSMLQCAIMDNGVFRGYVGFDECSVNRLWTQEQISLLQFLSEVLSMFLLKKRSQDKNAEMTANLMNILDNQESWIYIINPKSYEIHYMNKKLRAEGTQQGMKCYKAFMNKKAPCKVCPITSPEHSCVIANHKLGNLVRAQATEIIWNSQPELLITCHNIK